MTTHTPGPWRTVDGDHSCVVAIKVKAIGRLEQLIARVYGESSEAFEANSRLICCAPELLEACQFVMKYHEMHLGRADDSELPFQLSDAVQKAIAKATGQ